MTYNYKSILKTFNYSKENYKIISDFLLYGDIKNPDIKLKVDEVTKVFKPNFKSRDWFRLSTTKSYISAVINIKLETKNRKLEKIIHSWLKKENIGKDVFSTEWVRNPLGQNNDETTLFNFEDNSETEITDVNKKLSINLEMLTKSEDSKLIKLLKEIGMISVKKGGKNRQGEALQGTWINRDLSVKYAEWLDPKFSIWVSQKILELINDGVSWNEIRITTRKDYKPLTDAIEKYILPKYPKMVENIVFGKIANYINLKVIGQKAKEIRIKKGIEENELTRDFFTEENLKEIEKVQIFTEILISHFQLHDFKNLEKEINSYKL